MEAIVTIVAGIITLAIMVIKHFSSKERKAEKEKADFDKAMATNDFSAMSDMLSNSVDRVHEIQRNSKR